MIVEDGAAVEHERYPALSDIEQLQAVDEDGRVVATAVFASWDGRRWGCLQVDHVGPQLGASLTRTIRRYLKTTGQEIYSASDVGKYSTADRLHEVLGFERTGERVDGRDVWKWNSKRSPA